MRQARLLGRPAAGRLGVLRAQPRDAEARVLSARSKSDVEDLDGLAELAAEDESLRRRARRSSWPTSSAAWTRSRSSACSRAATTPATRSVSVHSGAGGTDSQDWAEMLLRMYLRWAQQRGFDVEMAEASAGRGGRHQVRHLPRARRERLRALLRREGRPPARAPVAVRRRPPAPHELRAGRGEPAGGGRRRHRDRRQRPADRDLPRVGRRRPAREQDRLGGADHAHPDEDRRPVPERALAVVEQADRDEAAADRSWSSWRSAGGARSWRARRARHRTSPGDRRSARTCCTRTRW